MNGSIYGRPHHIANCNHVYFMPQTQCIYCGYDMMNDFTKKLSTDVVNPITVGEGIISVPFGGEYVTTFESPHVSPKCTCGVDSVGTGKHSDWCAKK